MEAILNDDLQLKSPSRRHTCASAILASTAFLEIDCEVDKRDGSPEW
jgi:hypothetical protein